MIFLKKHLSAMKLLHLVAATAELEAVLKAALANWNTLSGEVRD